MNGVDEPNVVLLIDIVAPNVGVVVVEMPNEGVDKGCCLNREELDELDGIVVELVLPKLIVLVWFGSLAIVLAVWLNPTVVVENGLLVMKRPDSEEVFVAVNKEVVSPFLSDWN